MKKVKIFGAGSIGNHMAHASRKKGWAVDICDVDPKALDRTKHDIYPNRYQAWDNDIGLFTIENQPKGNYDLIIIGTPPKFHTTLALEALDERPKAILIEKPLSTPSLENLDELNKKAEKSSTNIFVGYNHVVSKAIQIAKEYVQNYDFGEIYTLDVEFREHWGGIFKAHHWLKGPSDSYLSQWKEGGGACGEHSHALNLWQHLAKLAQKGRVIEVNCSMQYEKKSSFEYDKLCMINLKTEEGFFGRVVQDVITLPTKKLGNIQGEKMSLNFSFEKQKGVDEVNLMMENEIIKQKFVNKTRPDDFIQEIDHIETFFGKENNKDSPINLQNGIETMLVISACYKSANLKRSVKINHDKPFSIAIN